jgi:excisionase family DNA binding protein
MVTREIQPITMKEEEAAAYLGVGVDLVRRLRNEGIIPHVRLGDRVVYYAPALDEFLMRESLASCRKLNGMRRIPL